MKFKSFFEKNGPKPQNQNEVAPDQPQKPSRRNFLKQAGAVAILSSGLGKGMIEAEKISEGKTLDDYKRDFTELINETELRETVLELKDKILTRYNIQVILDFYTPKDNSAQFYNLSELRLTKQVEALEAIVEELRKYPDFMITQYGLKNLVVAAQSTSEPRVGGYLNHGHIDSHHRESQSEVTLVYDWNSEQHVSKEFRLEENSISKDTLSGETAEEIRRRGQKNYFRQTIHHELTHFMIDEDGSETAPRQEEFLLTENWQNSFGSFNEENRKLYEDEALITTPDGQIKYDYGKILGRPIGFARGYSLKNNQEDRATIMEEMLKAYGYGFSNDSNESNKDDILMEKIKMLKDYYLRASSGLMNEEYWRGVTQGGSPNMEYHFLLWSERIINTPYADSIYKDLVDEETYQGWQNRLKHTPYA